MAVTIQTSGANLIGGRPNGDSNMAQIKITRATIVGGQHAPIGSVHSVERREATALFAAGKAVPWAEQPEPPMVREEVEADPGKHTASSGPACVKCGQDLTDKRRKRVESDDGLLCGACAKE